MSAFWPAWAGGMALGGIVYGYWRATGRTLGVSGAWDRVVHWRDEREVERLDAAFGDLGGFGGLAEACGELDDASFAAALEAGAAAVPSATTSSAAAPSAVAVAVAAPSPPVPLVGHAALVLGIFVGGLVAALVGGRFAWHTDMGVDYADVVARGWVMWPALFVGGLLVGFGTRLAGGCTSGHGLSGCARLQLASIVATAVFFGTAVAVSFLLWKVL